MAATVAAVKAAGGTMTGNPRPFGNTGIILGFAIDPAGNRIDSFSGYRRNSGLSVYSGFTIRE